MPMHLLGHLRDDQKTRAKKAKAMRLAENDDAYSANKLEFSDSGLFQCPFFDCSSG